MYGETPLQRAARNGHEEVVKMLLRHDDVDPGKLDERSETPGDGLLKMATWE